MPARLSPTTESRARARSAAERTALGLRLSAKNERRGSANPSGDRIPGARSWCFWICSDGDVCFGVEIPESKGHGAVAVLTRETLRFESEFVKTKNILVLGAVLLFGAVAWLAIGRLIESVVAPASREAAITPVFRFVNAGKNRDGASQPNAMAWQTSTALEDCAQVIETRKRDAKRRIDDLVRSEVNPSADRQDQDACAPFQLGEVAHGTKVEILGECGLMAKVRILSGSLRDREGCIPTDRLSETAG